MIKYSPELVQEMVTYIESGASNKDAATLVGICEDTFYTWKKEKNADGSPNPDYHPELSELLKKAEVKRKVAMVNRILTASKRSWQAAAWYLERKHNKEYGRVDKHEVSFNPHDEIKRIIERTNNNEISSNTDIGTDKDS